MSLFTPMSDFFKDVKETLLPATKRVTEGKINPAYSGMIIYGDLPQPHMLPRAYKSYAQEGYRGDPTIYKCISYISRNGAAIPPKLYTDESRGQEIEKHPILDLLKRPNNEQSGVAFREGLISYLLISGNSYQYALRPQKNGAPAELWALRPDFVQIVANSTRGITGYQYKPQNNPVSIVEYDAADVSHIKYWCPDDELYGLSPLEVAAIMVDQQIAARKWNLALLQNWARLPGAWVTPTPIGFNERERLENKLKEKFHGYKNAGAPPVLDAGLTWQSMAIEPAKMDWLEGLQYNAANVANIYNIPPMVIGDVTATTFDNMRQAEVYSYTEGIFPDLDKIYAEWQRWLVPMYPDLVRSGAFLYYDKESVEVIQELIQTQKDARSQRATAMWQAGQITLNESREMQGLQTVPQGNIYRIGNILVPADRVEDYAAQSLAFPAVPPKGVPEPLSPATTTEAPGNQETPPPSQVPAPLKPNGTAIPTASGSGTTKSRETKQDSWEDDQDQAITNRLADYTGRAVQYLQWVCDGKPCDDCVQNDGEVVTVGELFSNGAVLPPVHPNCMCQVEETSSYEAARNPIRLERKRRRRGDEYRDFIAAMTR